MVESSSGLRYFTGGSDGHEVDYREYRRWKQWCINKMLVMDKLPKESRGSFVWTLLQGRALEIVEHLKEEEYQKEGGDKVIFGLLDQRWPEKERTDEMGEHITEVFLLKSKEGESLRTWCARSRECFDRCQRKTGVSFPEEAKGWLLLNQSGMSDDQRAVVLARTVGDMKFDTLAQAMRSCFPDFVVPKRRATAAHYAEYDDESWWDEAAYPDQNTGEDASFNDVELFLAEHDQVEAPDAESYPEDEIAEVLAATWREKRQELNKLQRARKFHQAGEMRRSFRVEIEELKRKTKCNRCGKVGHWARECKVKLPQGSSSAAASSTTPPSSASLVQHFVCSMVEVSNFARGMLEQLRARRRPEATQEHPLCLVSSPGFAALDSGCGKSIIGRETLVKFREIWTQAGVQQPLEKQEMNVFRFGNGAQETATTVVEMPVSIAGRNGVVRAAVIQGNAPLLLSRPALKVLNAQMNFAKDELILFDQETVIPMATNEAGQYIVPVASFEKTSQPDMEPQAIALADPGPVSQDIESPAPPLASSDTAADSWELMEGGLTLRRIHRTPRRESFTPCKEGCPVPIEQLGSTRTTEFSCVSEDVTMCIRIIGLIPAVRTEC